MKEQSKQRRLSTVAALLVLAVFAGALLLVLLSGAGAYQRLSRKNNEAYDSRTGMQYLATKVRQAPAEAQLGSFGDGDALLIYETIGGNAYLTRVYCHEGWLMELFTVANGDFAPEDGEKILPAQALALARENGILTVTLTDSSGTASTMVLADRLGEGARP